MPETKPKTRVYTIVQGSPNGETFVLLVRAKSPDQALNHAVRSKFRVRMATQEDLIAFSHVKPIENAKEDPPEQTDMDDNVQAG